MGKGFNNYMCKKFFHPASADNLKRVYQAQKKSDAEKKKQDDLRSQYDKEQELYNNKALLSKESKERLEVNFMYEPPPGVKKFQEEKDDENGEPEFKFEWQRTWGHAPRESHLQAGDKVVEQPFGIQVCFSLSLCCSMKPSTFIFAGVRGQVYQVRQVRPHEHRQEMSALRESRGLRRPRAEHRPGEADTGDEGGGSRHEMERLGHEQSHQQRQPPVGGGGETEAGSGQGRAAEEHEQGREESVTEEIRKNGEEEKEER